MPRAELGLADISIFQLVTITASRIFYQFLLFGEFLVHLVLSVQSNQMKTCFQNLVVACETSKTITRL
uniref:Uncharacterized protein n=1 Tax=Pararge aegeria TaxID=116150 RepID=S4P9A3_9NEOP